MASPPNNYGNAISPPYPPHISIPPTSKRRSTDMPTSSPAVKRRKQSMLSATSSNHPLRQTSFPPDDADQGLRYSPSPSVDNMSTVSSNTKRGKKSTGKRKDDTSSPVSGNGRGLLSVNNGRPVALRGSKEPSRGPSIGIDADEEDDDYDDVNGMDLTVDMNIDNSEKTINERNYIIREAMDSLQQDRFDAWHAAKLNTPMIKKLINQTLSQSVPETVVFAIKTAVKLFTGEIIERARKVQEQWIAVSLETQLGRPKPMLALPSPPDSTSTSETFSSNSHTETGAPSQEMPGSSYTSSNNDILQKEKEEKEVELDRKNRGPLLPEHLIEAFRRYKEFDGPDREMLNVWRAQRATGAERFGVKNRKGRLFGGGRALG